MISGPITPLTPEGIRGYLRRHGDALESGLTLVGDGIESGGTVLADGIARDARGDAALLLFVLGDGHPASRVLALKEFLQRSGRALGRSLAELGLRFDLRCRILIIGCDLSERWLADLEALALPELEGWDVQILTVGGQRRLVVEPVLGESAKHGEEDLTVPAGIAEPELREACAEWLGIVKRLEPAIAVTGDRFSRTLTWSGRRLAHWSVRGGEAQVDVTGFDPVAIRDRAQVADAADNVLRRYLSLAGVAEGGGAGGRQRESLPEDLPEAVLAAPDRVDLERLRRGAAETRVSEAEYQALGRVDQEAPAAGNGGWSGSP